MYTGKERLKQFCTTLLAYRTHLISASSWKAKKQTGPDKEAIKIFWCNRVIPTNVVNSFLAKEIELIGLTIIVL